MRVRRDRAALTLAAGAAAVLLSLSAGTPTGTGEAAAAAEQVSRGQYLTHDVAMCVQCHSPRDESGVLRPGSEFRGAPIPVASPFPGTRWATAAPNLRGLEGFSDGEVVRLLSDGIGHRGAAPDPPMPPFRMNEGDAKAIVAYLRSLR